jgi:uncharacterized membrane protein (DUF2068 family)
MRWSKSIRAVAAFEAAKGLLVLIAGAGIFSLASRDVQHALERLVRHLHLDLANHYPRIFLDAVAGGDDRGLWKLAALAGLYAVTRFVEAYGLWRERRWAEWLAALSGGVYIPFEIHGVLLGHPWAAVALVLNVAVVAVMGLSLRLPRHARL